MPLCGLSQVLRPTHSLQQALVTAGPVSTPGHLGLHSLPSWHVVPVDFWPTSDVVSCMVSSPQKGHVADSSASLRESALSHVLVRT